MLVLSEFSLTNFKSVEHVLRPGCSDYIYIIFLTRFIAKSNAFLQFYRKNQCVSFYETKSKELNFGLISTQFWASKELNFGLISTQFWAFLLKILLKVDFFLKSCIIIIYFFDFSPKNNKIYCVLTPKMPKKWIFPRIAQIFSSICAYNTWNFIDFFAW